eukprot:1435876-Rhodomonas_salina.1
MVVGNRIGPSLLLPSAGGGAFGEAGELRPQGGAAGRRTGGSSDTFAVALGDFNQDGRVDIALGRSGAPTVVLFNNGTGAFEEEVELPGGDTETQGLVVVDGDGDLDLVVADYGSPNWLIWNDGAGRFVEPLQLPRGSGTRKGYAPRAARCPVLCPMCCSTGKGLWDAMCCIVMQCAVLVCNVLYCYAMCGTELGYAATRSTRLLLGASHSPSP